MRFEVQWASKFRVGTQNAIALVLRVLDLELELRIHP